MLYAATGSISKNWLGAHHYLRHKRLALLGGHALFLHRSAYVSLQHSTQHEV